MGGGGGVAGRRMGPYIQMEEAVECLLISRQGVIQDFTHEISSRIDLHDQPEGFVIFVGRQKAHDIGMLQLARLFQLDLEDLQRRSS